MANECAGVIPIASPGIHVLFLSVFDGVSVGSSKSPSVSDVVVLSKELYSVTRWNGSQHPMT